MNLRFKNWASVFALIALPLLLNLPTLLNLVDSDPSLLYSGLHTRVDRGVLPGYPVIDPTIGFDAQPLGRFEADELLSGRMPWWNPYEGAGFPLGEGIGNAAFFLPSLLFALPNGQVVNKMFLEILTGLLTLLLLRKIGFGWLAATVAAALFEMNGTLCWIGGDLANTAPSLPLLLYGIECVRTNAEAKKAGGWIWVAVALALSLFGGFPELAYLNGLLALAWTILRFVQIPRASKWLFARGLLWGFSVGALLAAPVMIAFVDFLRVGFAGGHTSAAYAHIVLPETGLIQFFLPYVWGPIFVYTDLAALWGSVGGFAGVALSVIAVSALFGARERPLRWLLGAWTIFTLGATFGVPILHGIFTAIPLVDFTAYCRYLATSWEFTLTVLVAFAIRDAIELDARMLVKYYAIAATVIVIAVGAAAYASTNWFALLWMKADFHRYPVRSAEFGLAVLIALALAVQIPRTRVRALALTVIVLVEAMINFMIPTLSFPSGGAQDMAPIAFLQQHQGLQRFYTFGPIAPNYGTYYGIASINYNDLPVPNEWLNYVHTRLDRFSDSVNFVGYMPSAGPGVPSRQAELRRNLAGYEAAGVKYVVSSSSDEPFARIYETSLEPGDGSVVPLSADVSAVAVLKNSVPAGTIASVDVLQANYGHTADGDMLIRVCTGNSACRSVRRSLTGVTDNAYLRFDLDKPITVDRRKVTIAISVPGNKHSEGLWTYNGDRTDAQAIAVGGVPVPGKVFRLRFQYVPAASSPRLAFHDSIIKIYELRHPRPYFGADDGCTLKVVSRTQVDATCAAAAKLRRLELFMPGWAASVNGIPAGIVELDRAFQQVDVPAGRSTVAFSFSPPGIGFGYATFAAGILALVLVALKDRRLMKLEWL